jgi:phosphoglycerol transferase MdoB-like AlkP superfamily enzyme
VYVSAFGGNTANTDIEFLTGNSIVILPTNSVPYQLFIIDKFPSLTYTLEQQNYVGNIEMHPYHATGYNRNTIYPLLGFEKFITLSEFNTDNMLRGRITDETDFNKIIEEYELTKSKSDNPFFLFNVTMQNHSGYKVTDPNFIQKVTIEDENYYDEDVQNYLSLAKYTDEAVEKIVKYFDEIDDPTVIIFFGDHQPGLPQAWYNKMFGQNEETLSAEELMVKYQVPFFAWANYDIPEENIDRISMNYLSSYLMDQIGVNLTKYQQYLLDVHEQVPVMNSLGYWGADENYYGYDDTQSPYYEKINEYRCVQYNNMFDKGNRVDSMFYIN